MDSSLHQAGGEDSVFYKKDSKPSMLVQEETSHVLSNGKGKPLKVCDGLAHNCKNFDDKSSQPAGHTSNGKQYEGEPKIQDHVGDHREHSHVNQNQCQGNVQIITNDIDGLVINTPLSEMSGQYTNKLSDEVLNRQKKIINTTWPSTTTLAQKEFPSFCHMYEKIREKGLPNFLGAKIPVSSNLKILEWSKYLKDYHDKEIVTFLQYGWPVGFHSETPPQAVYENHSSAKRYNDHVRRFVEKELNHQALVGPFSALPFQPWCRLSPLMTRPKKASIERRVILDLSFPHGAAPNDGIDINHHFGKDISYTLPSIKDLITKLQEFGKGAYIWKGDLSRAYRQIRIDPLDTPLLGLKVDDLVYLDLCPAFGCKSSSSACQRMANAVVYIMGHKGHFVLAYLHDFAGGHAEKLEAEKAYNDFIELTSQLGLQLALDKCVRPTTEIEWLGFNINTTQMTVSIPQAKLDETIQECEKWSHRKRANRRMIQSILGKLIHVSACVAQGRKFVSRIIDTLRSMGNHNWTNVTEEFLLDIKWFLAYARAANGIHIYHLDRPQIELECDSSKEGGGGHSRHLCYAWKYSSQHKTLYDAIHQLEAINVVLAYKTLAPHLNIPGAHVTIFTDNSASSFAIQSGKTKDKVLASCSREMWLQAAKNDHLISIVHKPGEQLVLADALSRRFSEPAKALLADTLIQQNCLTCIEPVLDNYVFFTPGL